MKFWYRCIHRVFLPSVGGRRGGLDGKISIKLWQRKLMWQWRTNIVTAFRCSWIGFLHQPARGTIGPPKKRNTLFRHDPLLDNENINIPGTAAAAAVVQSSGALEVAGATVATSSTQQQFRHTYFPPSHIILSPYFPAPSQW